MVIAFVLFDKLKTYGGFNQGVRNTILAAQSVGLETKVITLQHTKTNRNREDILDIPCDILHFSNFRDIAYLVGTSFPNAVVHLHGYCFELCPPTDELIIGNRQISQEVNNILSNSKLVYSSYSLKQFIKYPGKWIWNCVNPSLFYPSDKEGTGLISNINLTYAKGIDRLANIGNIDVIGRTSDDLSGKIQVEIPSNVNQIGEIDSTTIPDILRKHRIFIHPSRIESCSLAIIEAMTCGLPIIASNVGDNKYIIEHAGITLKEWNKESVERAIDIIEYNYSYFRNNAIVRSTAFTPLKMGMELLNVYFEVKSGHSEHYA